MKNAVGLLSLLLFFLFYASPRSMHAQGSGLVNAAALQSGSFMVRTPPSHNAPNLMSGSVGDFTPEALFDLSPKMWCSEEGAEFPHVFVLELTEPFIIEQLAFDNHCENYEGISAQDVRVEFATDRASPTYALIGEFKLPDNESKTFPIAPTEARLIRISILSNYGHGAFTELAEFGAMGRPVTSNVHPVNIDGEWETNWGPLRFEQNGTGVSGNYEYHDGDILYGGVNRNQITYKWVEESVGLEGWSLLFMNREGTRLTGVWCHGSDWSSYGFWIMERDRGVPFAPIVESNEPGPGVSDRAHGVSEQVVRKMEETLNEQEKLVLYGINFTVNSAKITNESFNVLDHVARLLENQPGLVIRIEGHTDNDGTNESNQALSLARASAVRDYLVKGHGIAADRIAVDGKGEEAPIAANATEAGKAANRRVEIHRVK